MPKASSAKKVAASFTSSDDESVKTINGARARRAWKTKKKKEDKKKNEMTDDTSATSGVSDTESNYTDADTDDEKTPSRRSSKSAIKRERIKKIAERRRLLASKSSKKEDSDATIDLTVDGEKLDDEDDATLSERIKQTKRLNSITSQTVITVPPTSFPTKADASKDSPKSAADKGEGMNDDEDVGMTYDFLNSTPPAPQAPPPVDPSLQVLNVTPTKITPAVDSSRVIVQTPVKTTPILVPAQNMDVAVATSVAVPSTVPNLAAMTIPTAPPSPKTVGISLLNNAPKVPVKNVTPTVLQHISATPPPLPVTTSAASQAQVANSKTSPNVGTIGGNVDTSGKGNVHDNISNPLASGSSSRLHVSNGNAQHTPPLPLANNSFNGQSMGHIPTMVPPSMQAAGHIPTMIPPNMQPSHSGSGAHNNWGRTAQDPYGDYKPPSNPPGFDPRFHNVNQSLQGSSRMDTSDQTFNRRQDKPRDFTTSTSMRDSRESLLNDNLSIQSRPVNMDNPFHYPSFAQAFPNLGPLLGINQQTSFNDVTRRIMKWKNVGDKIHWCLKRDGRIETRDNHPDIPLDQLFLEINISEADCLKDGDGRKFVTYYEQGVVSLSSQRYLHEFLVPHNNWLRLARTYGLSIKQYKFETRNDTDSHYGLAATWDILDQLQLKFRTFSENQDKDLITLAKKFKLLRPKESKIGAFFTSTEQVDDSSDESEDSDDNNIFNNHKRKVSFQQNNKNVVVNTLIFRLNVARFCQEYYLVFDKEKATQEIKINSEGIDGKLSHDDMALYQAVISVFNDFKNIENQVVDNSKKDISWNDQQKMGSATTTIVHTLGNFARVAEKKFIQWDLASTYEALETKLKDDNSGVDLWKIINPVVFKDGWRDEDEFKAVALELYNRKQPLHNIVRTSIFGKQYINGSALNKNSLKEGPLHKLVVNKKFTTKGKYPLDSELVILDGSCFLRLIFVLTNILHETEFGKADCFENITVHNKLRSKIQMLLPNLSPFISVIESIFPRGVSQLEANNNLEKLYWVYIYNIEKLAAGEQATTDEAARNFRLVEIRRQDQEDIDTFMSTLFDEFDQRTEVIKKNKWIGSLLKILTCMNLDILLPGVEILKSTKDVVKAIRSNQFKDGFTPPLTNEVTFTKGAPSPGWKNIPTRGIVDGKMVIAALKVPTTYGEGFGREHQLYEQIGMIDNEARTVISHVVQYYKCDPPATDKFEEPSNEIKPNNVMVGNLKVMHAELLLSKKPKVSIDEIRNQLTLFANPPKSQNGNNGNNGKKTGNDPNRNNITVQMPSQPTSAVTSTTNTTTNQGFKRKAIGNNKAVDPADQLEPDTNPRRKPRYQPSKYHPHQGAGGKGNKDADDSEEEGN